ncbi:MAG: hypothetical protein ABL932_06070 [Terricaulis sp.]
MSDGELNACFSAMRNGHAYFNGERIDEGDGEERVRDYIEVLRERAAGAAQ